MANLYIECKNRRYVQYLSIENDTKICRIEIEIKKKRDTKTLRYWMMHSGLVTALPTGHVFSEKCTDKLRLYVQIKYNIYQANRNQKGNATCLWNIANVKWFLAVELLGPMIYKKSVFIWIGGCVHLDKIVKNIESIQNTCYIYGRGPDNTCTRIVIIRI